MVVPWVGWAVKGRIRDKTVAVWQSVRKSLGRTVDDLVEQLAASPQNFGSLRATCKAKTRHKTPSPAGQQKAAVAKMKADRDRIGVVLHVVAGDGAGSSG